MSCVSCATLTPGLLDLEDARQRLLATARPLPPSEPCPLDAALGRVLAAPVSARLAIPSADNSAMDGYALRVADLVSPPDGLPIIQRIPAGCAPAPLAEGGCARIFTGAPIPPGANCVVPQERCRIDDQGRVHVQGEALAGANIRRRGEESLEGTPLLPAGQRLDAPALALLANQGIVEVEVFARLKVALVSTGDELVEPGMPLAPGQLYNSNRVMLSALLQQQDCTVIDLGIVADTAAALRETLSQARDRADVVICTGGVSAGEEDHVRPVLAELGELLFHGVAMKPGKPFAFGRLHGAEGDVPLLGLPGNPVAALVTWQVLGQAFVQACQGRHPRPLQQFFVKAGFSRRATHGRRELLRVVLDHAELEPMARLAGGQGSAMLGAACQADGYLMVPGDTPVMEGNDYAFLPVAQFAI
ncbi:MULTISPECIES: gephyrin-like molybdotransferase Glp [Chromohalobacter]|uniref:Molybdopterin molybdenumtransferase n=1 Tax=Chromohalobacter canadensis TaxID=141389 RepID=A0A285VHV0_9GAMM|nr:MULTISPECIES: gephyrin-like molybdotransferase Glp [Chromohalobacter]NWO10796.1 molybdopterin molybdotransferase MoeA [Chromohalobacter salexigens]MCT8468544.1 molybdopterin molybdotransferase MoeA [Chromohalobacter canadensis]MCT8471599.1 molybdopterin molybdotransferase MoeA [Chromohalobacter canadensis]MCT8499052.1 molybdopterin molybdotransferase MoeA [Chromohalobacter canadensis]MDV6317743.1 molybdopterin molybdotransferase MoeA [Chromohalobacter sp. HP20-39]